MRVTSGLGEASTLISADGTVCGINNAVLFAVGIHRREGFWRQYSFDVMPASGHTVFARAAVGQG